MALQMRATTRQNGQSAGSIGQIPALDGLRGIAALMVLTTHVAFHTGVAVRPVIGPLTSRLDFGVCLFFLLSGFLLYRPWSRAAVAGRRGPSVRDYARKRFARVYPAYLVVVVVVLGFYAPAQPVTAEVWARYLTLTQVYASGMERRGLTQTWSLAMEVAFYLVLPVLAHLATRTAPRSRAVHRQLAVLAAMVVAAVAFNAVRAWGSVLPADVVGYWLPTHLDWFAAGMLLATIRVAVDADAARPAWFDRLVELSRDWGSWLVAAVLLYTLALTPLAGPLTAFDPITSFTTGPWFLILKNTLYGACAFALMAPLVLTRADHPYARVLSHPAARWLGMVSYGVFLWHLVLLGQISIWLGIEPFRGWFWVLWPLTVAASITAAWISWHLLERRWIAWSLRPR